MEHSIDEVLQTIDDDIRKDDLNSCRRSETESRESSHSASLAETPSVHLHPNEMKKKEAPSTGKLTEEGAEVVEECVLNLEQLPVVPTTSIERKDEQLVSPPSHVCELAD